jgi:hypothetical protein
MVTVSSLCIFLVIYVTWLALSGCLCASSGRSKLGSAMEVDGQQGAAAAAARASGIIKEVVQLEAKVRWCVRMQQLAAVQSWVWQGVIAAGT